MAKSIEKHMELLESIKVHFYCNWVRENRHVSLWVLMIVMVHVNTSPTEHFPLSWIKREFLQSPHFNLAAFKWKDEILSVKFYTLEKVFDLKSGTKGTYNKIKKETIILGGKRILQVREDSGLFPLSLFSGTHAPVSWNHMPQITPMLSDFCSAPLTSSFLSDSVISL